MHCLAKYFLFIHLCQACIDQLAENVLYKIRNFDFPQDKFYAFTNSKEIHGDTGPTNSSTFLWFLIKHPIKINTYMIYNLNRTDYVWEGYPKIANWNTGISNNTSNQWLQMFDVLGDKNSTQNFLKCLMSVRDTTDLTDCFFFQGNFGPFLYKVNCTLLDSNNVQKAPSNLNIFEFIRMPGIRPDLTGNCTTCKLTLDEKTRRCKNRAYLMT